MKSNDQIPEDEMLLAEALSEAKSRGLGWSSGAMFRYGNGAKPIACCAYGALVLTERVPGSFVDRPRNLHFIHYGNDHDREWTADADDGESLGWAFRCAMTQEES